MLLKLFLHFLATNRKYAAVVYDAESAFLQLRLKPGERLVVRPPADVRSDPKELWDMHVPLYGWRKASASWQDYQAE